MANVHGFGDIRNNPNNPNRQPMLQPSDNDGIMAQQIRQNKVPFLNTMKEVKPALEETIPYTLRIVWCPTLSFKTVTFLYLISIWVIYVTTLVFGVSMDKTNVKVLAPKAETLDQFGANNPEKLHNGQIWRLVTPAFLHADILHIVMNSISMLFFMSRLEKCYGAKIIALLCLVAAITGNITSAIFIPIHGLSVGASTVIFGIIGGLISYMLINWQVLGRVRSQLCCIIGLITFMLIFSSLGNGIDMAGHLGGLAGGFSFGVAAFPGIKTKPKYFMIGGFGLLLAYTLTMFLIFYL